LSFLLDTNAISEIRRNRDPRVRAWSAVVDDADLYLSVMTLGEIRIGIDRLRNHDAVQADVFARWLGELQKRFADRILPIDARVADEWGRLNAIASRNTVDSLIAATARVHELTVVTRNTKDFEGCDVPLFNPWDYEEPGDEDRGDAI
jgi:predicted nucleic acid-binding protein